MRGVLWQEAILENVRVLRIQPKLDSRRHRIATLKSPMVLITQWREENDDASVGDSRISPRDWARCEEWISRSILGHFFRSRWTLGFSGKNAPEGIAFRCLRSCCSPFAMTIEILLPMAISSVRKATRISRSPAAEFAGRWLGTSQIVNVASISQSSELMVCRERQRAADRCDHCRRGDHEKKLICRGLLCLAFANRSRLVVWGLVEGSLRLVQRRIPIAVIGFTGKVNPRWHDGAAEIKCLQEQPGLVTFNHDF